MTIENIIGVLDERHNKDIHRIYHTELKWCYITARNGERVRLDEKMSDEEVNRRIEFIVKINTNYNRTKRVFFASHH
jgi:hypothetical protein